MSALRFAVEATAKSRPSVAREIIALVFLRFIVFLLTRY